MAWITRGRCRFYVRSVRRGSRVVHEYFGSGAEAELAAALDVEKRHRREVARAVAAGKATSWRSAVEPLDQLGVRTNLLVQAVLLADGYHQHHQGEWRRRRDHGRTT